MVPYTQRGSSGECAGHEKVNTIMCETFLHLSVKRKVKSPVSVQNNGDKKRFTQGLVKMFKLQMLLPCLCVNLSDI